MSLNIKSEETHRMAKELARLTGESITTAVGEAIKGAVAASKVGQETPANRTSVCRTDERAIQIYGSWRTVVRREGLAEVTVR